MHNKKTVAEIEILWIKNVTYSSVISCNKAFNREYPHPLFADKKDFKNVMIANWVAPAVEFKILDPSLNAIETNAGTHPLIQSEKLCIMM